MTLKSLKTFGSFAVTVAMALVVSMALALAACTGADGHDGRDGKDGNNGIDPPPPPAVTINARALTEEQWAALRLKGEITAVTMGTTPVVTYRLTDDKGTPISGMSWESKAASSAYATYPNLAFGIAKLIPERYDADNGRMVAPSRWVNYIVTNAPTTAAPTTWSPTRPTTDNIGTLVDNGDGTYKYTFRRDLTQIQAQLDAAAYTGANVKADLDDVTYQPSLTHRVTIQVSGAFRGTGNTNTRDANTPDGTSSGRVAINMVGPLNLVYDFVPATGKPVTEADVQRELVSTAACNDCHGVLGHSFHNGGRTDARYCAMCHTDQRKYGYADGSTNKQKDHAVGDFVMLGHTLHLGSRGFKETLSPRTEHNYNYAGVQYKETGYPMDIRNCVQCHKSDRAGAPAAQGDNWNTKPSRLACGACHDGIDWTERHHGGVRTDDSSCGTCHRAEADNARSPFNSHRPADVTKQNPTTSDRYHNFAYDLKTATVNAERNLVVVFRIKLDGETMATRASLAPEGFTAGPRFHLVYALPQDGIEKPADFNVYGNGHYATLANILNGTFGTLSAAPDADGFWTATINGFPTYAAANTGVTIPATASMLTCYMDGGWTQSDIGDNFQPPQGADTPPGAYTAYRVTPAKKVLVGGVTGNVARREVVSAAKCNDCHESLGTSYITRYYGAHAGGAVDDPALCGVCHYVNRAGNGWSGNVQYIVHAVHGIGKRNVQYARYINVDKRPPYTEDGKGIGGYGYPGVLNNCEQCHLPGTYDFSSTATLNALPNMLWSTVVAGNITVGAQTSPYVETGTYGAAISYADRVNAPLGTLVNSPITHACFGCHDTPSAIEHMKINGGAFFESRDSLNGGVLNAKLTKKVETCLLCHGSGRSADIKKAHGKF